MKTSLKQFLILFMLVLLGSCTVTKRTYTKGYHIEWRKNYIGKGDVAQVKSEKDVVPDKTTPKEIQVDQGLHQNTIENEPEIIEEALLDDGLKRVEYKSDAVTESELEEEVILDVEQESKSEVRHASVEGMPFLGVIGGILLILGILIFLASLYLFFGYSNLGNLFDSLVLGGGGFISGLLGILLFILILLLIIVFALFIQFIGGYGVGIVLGLGLALAGGILLLISYLSQ